MANHLPLDGRAVAEAYEGVATADRIRVLLKNAVLFGWPLPAFFTGSLWVQGHGIAAALTVGVFLVGIAFWVCTEVATLRALRAWFSATGQDEPGSMVGRRVFAPDRQRLLLRHDPALKAQVARHIA